VVKDSTQRQRLVFQGPFKDWTYKAKDLGYILKNSLRTRTKDSNTACMTLNCNYMPFDEV